MSYSKDIILYNVRLPLKDLDNLFEIKIQDGVFKQINIQQSNGEIEQHHEVVSLNSYIGDLSDQTEIDLEGRILLPSFIDIHTHLDKAFSLKQVPNKSGTLKEAISNYSKQSHLFTYEDIKQRVTRGALQSLSYGTTHIRTHVNFDLNIGEKNAFEQLRAVMDVKRELSSYISMQIVPMFSSLTERSSREMSVIEEVLRLDVDGIGGAPHLFSNANENIEKLFQLAIKYNRFIDLHIDESDDPSMSTITQLINKTKQYQFQGRVTAGHLCSLSAMENKEASRIISRIAEEKINVITLPAANMYLQGRGDIGIVRRGITRVKELIEGDVTVATASDNVNDPFHPFGRGDMIQIGLLTAYTAHMASEKQIIDVLKMITTIPGEIYGLKNHGINLGAPANFVVIDTQDVNEVFASISPTRYMHTKGKWLTSLKTQVLFEDEKLFSIWNKIKN